MSLYFKTVLFIIVHRKVPSVVLDLYLLLKYAYFPHSLSKKILEQLEFPYSIITFLEFMVKLKIQVRV